MKQKRVFIFVFSLMAGGAEKMLTTISRYIDKRFAITFVIYRFHPGDDFPFKGDVIEIAPAFDRQSNYLSKGWQHLRAWWRIFQVIRRHKPDTMVTCLPAMNLMVLLAYNLVRCINGFTTRVIVRIANSNEVDRPVRFGNLFERKRIFLPLLKLLYRSVDRFIVISEGLGPLLSDNLGVPKERITRIYNGLEPQFMKEILKKKIPKKYDFMTQGRLVPVKRHDVLLKALAEVKEKHSKVILRIVGAGELEESTRTLAETLGLKDNVVMGDGWISPEALFSEMAASRIFVMSSDNEGFGMVIIEAMAVGVPIISTDCPSGPPEILDKGKYGILTPKGDPHALAQAMLKLLENPREMARYQKLSLQRAGDFDIHAITKEYEAVF